jgi:DNA-binding response OmpR family regulator
MNLPWHCLNILCVDDSNVIRKSFSIAFKRGNYCGNVDILDGTEDFSVVDFAEYDFILLDWILSDTRTSEPIVKMIQESSFHGDLIILTGEQSRKKEIEAMGLRVLEKPINLIKLKELFYQRKYHSATTDSFNEALFYVHRGGQLKWKA